MCDLAGLPNTYIGFKADGKSWFGASSCILLEYGQLTGVGNVSKKLHLMLSVGLMSSPPLSILKSKTSDMHVGAQRKSVADRNSTAVSDS